MKDYNFSYENSTLVMEGFYRNSSRQINGGGLSGEAIICFYTIIFVLALVGNTLVIITLVYNKRMRTVTNVFLLNLSVSDLLLALFCMPFTIIPMLMRTFVFGATVCFMVRYLQGVSVGVSCFTLVAISMERYFAICRPLQSRKWQTLSHSYKIIGIIWILASILMIPIAIHTKHRFVRTGLYICRENWDLIDLERAYTVLLDISLLVIPLLIMSLAYGFVVYTLWDGIQSTHKENGSQNGRHYDSHQSLDGNDMNIKSYGVHSSIWSRSSSSQRKGDHRRIIRHSNPERSRAAKIKVIRMLFAVVVEYFVCWTPLYATQTWRSFHEESLREHFSNISLSLIYMLAFVSSTCNPITYCLMNKKFRQSFSMVLGCCSPKPRRHYSSHSEHATSLRLNGTKLSTYKTPNHEKETGALLMVEKKHIMTGNIGEGVQL